MAGSLRMYDISRTPNSEILDDTTTGGPALPTIAELNPPVASKIGWIWRGWRSVFFFPNGEFITEVKLYRQLQPLLADSAPTASNIYLVTRPKPFENPAGSLQHWSFYTQGVFYHLSAPDLPREITEKSHNASKSRDVVCRLRCDDLRNVNSEDYIRLWGPSGRKVLVAYKVGQTDYGSDQVLRLAEWTVGQLFTYGTFSANCQHFATTMVRRTAMRVGDRSAFAGTAIQIADWDLQRGIEPHSNGIDHGFLVSPPLPADESFWLRFISTCSWLFQCRGYIDPWRIRILYEKGPDAIGAWHPPGYYAKQFGGHAGYHAKQFVGHGRLIRGACVEFKEDLSQKRWKDAFYGRYQELPDGTRKRPLQRTPKIDSLELTRANMHPQPSLARDPIG